MHGTFPQLLWLALCWIFCGAVAITACLAIGSRLEENKRVALYGERCFRYRKKVSGLIPRPWRQLTLAEARTPMREPPLTRQPDMSC
jgi:protein-S-isoprenylcysteine O-methyltransferase Ste14